MNITEEDIKYLQDGASSSWILTSAAMIFLMQPGFILVEISALKKQHYSDVVIKNVLDTIAGALGFWFAGFGIAFSPTDKYGFFGIDPNWFATKKLSHSKGD
jgi:Amt family ammonium transporter